MLPIGKCFISNNYTEHVQREPRGSVRCRINDLVLCFSLTEKHITFLKRQIGTKMSLRHVSPCSQQETGAPSRSTRTVNHRTSRPGCEHHLIQSAHSPFCRFLAAPSSCLHPAGISTTQQMAPLAWKTFTLSVSTWWNSLPSVHILYHQYGGGVVAQWLALAFHSNKVSFLVPVCGLAFTMCLCRFLPPLYDQ